MRPADLVKFLAPLRRRVAHIVERAVVHLVNDALKMQGLQIGVLADEELDRVERFQEYGFTSHPHPGAEAIVVALGGTRNRAVVVAVDDRRYRLVGLAAGEVALYSDEGDKIVLKRGNVIEITAATKVQLATPSVNTTGVYKVGDTQVVAAQGAAVADAAGGATVDGEARAAINALLARCRAHGLIAA